MSAPGSRLPALACAAALLAGCAQRNAPRPAQNADERLADTVMDAIERGDMHAVLGEFVPARRTVLLDPVRVKAAHDLVSGAGDFVGARQIRAISRIDGRTVYLTAYFASGEEPVRMEIGPDGKLVHYSVGLI